MRGLLFIVSPKRPEIFEGLKATLGRERGVEVIYDRRVGLPRREEHPGPDRRRQKKIDEEIAEYGWAVVDVQ